MLKRADPVAAHMRLVYLERVRKKQVPEPFFDDSLEEECATDKTAAEAVNVLKTVLLQCQAIDPADRPRMDAVTNTLISQGLLSNHYQKIYDQVIHALENVMPYKPRKDEYPCNILDQFLPPSF